MYKIGVVGKREAVLGFMALGVGVFEAESVEKAIECVDKMAKEDYAIIFLPQSLAKEMKEATEKYEKSRLPAIIPIPDQSGAEYGEEILKNAVIKAIGADIL